MSLSANDKFLLNNRMGKLASQVGLGTLLETALSEPYIIKYAGSFTTVGGDASESITVTGATSSDIALVFVKTAGATPRSVVAAAAGTNAIAVTMSGDPSTDHVLVYVVLRAQA